MIIWIRRITVLAGVSLAIVLVPRIVHAEEDQTFLSKNDPHLKVINQQLPSRLAKSVDVLQLPKDKIPFKIKRDALDDHPVKSVEKAVNNLGDDVKEATQHPTGNADTNQPKRNLKQESKNEKVKKPIPIVRHAERSVKMHLHPQFIKHQPPMGKPYQHHPSGKKPEDQPLVTSRIMMPGSSPSGKSNNSNTSSFNLLGLLDKHWFVKNIRLNKPLYLHDIRRTQWENAPPSPPPEKSLRFLS